jgi:hypothetical protein
MGYSCKLDFGRATFTTRGFMSAPQRNVLRVFECLEVGAGKGRFVANRIGGHPAYKEVPRTTEHYGVVTVVAATVA